MNDLHPTVLIPEARDWARNNSGPVDREFIEALAVALEESVTEVERLRCRTDSHEGK